MGILIGVHGLDNKPPRQQLKSSWETAILEGLGNGCNLTGSLPLVMRYWADLYYPLASTVEREPYTRRTATSSRHKVEVEFQQGRQENQALLDLRPEVMAAHYPDLARYYREPGLASQTRLRLRHVLRQLQDQPLLLISHSMGCLIAFDVLCESQSRLLNCEMVTFGCPLGFPQLRRRMQAAHGTLSVPAPISTWTNYVDPRDPVACLGLDQIFENGNSGNRIIDRIVNNDYRNPKGSQNPHKIYGYLRSRQFTQQVRSFLGLEG